MGRARSSLSGSRAANAGPAGPSFELVESTIQWAGSTGLSRCRWCSVGSAKRVLVVGGRENDERRRAKFGEKVEPGHARHLDVDKKQIDRCCQELFQRGVGIGFGARVGDAAARFEEARQPLGGQRLVIDNECERFHAVPAIGSSSTTRAVEGS